MIFRRPLILIVLITTLSQGGEFPGLNAWYHSQTLSTAGIGDILMTGISEFNNPALLPYLENRFNLAWVKYPAGITAESAIFNQRRSRYWLGFSIKHLGYGIFQGRDENNTPTADYSSGDLQLTVSLARKVFKGRGSLGLSGGIFNSRLEKTQATAITFSPGLVIGFHRLPGQVGIRYSHLGTVLSSYTRREDHLPGVLVVSYGTQLAHLPLEIALDLRKEQGQGNPTWGIGGIFRVSNALFIKGGFSSDESIHTVQDFFHRSGLGLGFNNGKLTVDLGLFLYHPGGSVFGLGLAIRY